MGNSNCVNQFVKIIDMDGIEYLINLNAITSIKQHYYSDDKEYVVYFIGGNNFVLINKETYSNLSSSLVGKTLNE